MRPTTKHPAVHGHRRTVRRFGVGLISTIATLALLSACGAITEAPTQDAGATPDVTAGSEGTTIQASETTTREPVATTAAPAATPSSGPETTSEPEPEPAPSEQEAEEEPAPVGPQTFSGTGSEVLILTPLGEAVYFATVTHNGSRNIALWSVDENGQNIDLLVNEIGTYAGDVALNFREDPAALRIEADGEWTIELVHLSQAPRWDGASKYEGSGDSIVIVDGVADGLTPITLTHDGESNFTVWSWGENVDLIVNEIGRYDGTTLLPNGSLVLQVTADGNWTLAKN